MSHSYHSRLSFSQDSMEGTKQGSRHGTRISPSRACQLHLNKTKPVAGWNPSQLHHCGLSSKLSDSNAGNRAYVKTVSEIPPHYWKNTVFAISSFDLVAANRAAAVNLESPVVDRCCF